MTKSASWSADPEVSWRDISLGNGRKMVLGGVRRGYTTSLKVSDQGFNVILWAAKAFGDSAVHISLGCFAFLSSLHLFKVFTLRLILRFPWCHHVIHHLEQFAPAFTIAIVIFIALEFLLLLLLMWLFPHGTMYHQG